MNRIILSIIGLMLMGIGGVMLSRGVGDASQPNSSKIDESKLFMGDEIFCILTVKCTSSDKIGEPSIQVYSDGNAVVKRFNGKIKKSAHGRKWVQHLVKTLNEAGFFSLDVDVIQEKVKLLKKQGKQKIVFVTGGGMNTVDINFPKLKKTIELDSGEYNSRTYPDLAELKVWYSCLALLEKETDVQSLWD